MVIYPSALAPLATLSEHPALGESIAYQLNGLTVVFIALSAIWALMELIGFLFRKLRTAAPSPTAKPAVVSAPPALLNGNRPPHEVVAAITSAVAVTMEEPHRILEILPLDQARDWAREGRREIFASHKTR